jgi:hypothetical protein
MLHNKNILGILCNRNNYAKCKNLWLKKTPEFKIFDECYVPLFIIGNPDLKYKYKLVNDNVLEVRTQDFYENQAQKLHLFFNFCYEQNAKLVFKIDDDVNFKSKLGLYFLTKFINYLSVFDFSIFGKSIYTLNFSNYWHLGKVRNVLQNELFCTSYYLKSQIDGGSGYVLNKRGLKRLYDTKISNDIIYEDLYFSRIFNIKKTGGGVAGMEFFYINISRFFNSIDSQS